MISSVAITTLWQVASLFPELKLKGKEATSTSPMSTPLFAASFPIEAEPAARTTAPVFISVVASAIMFVSLNRLCNSPKQELSVVCVAAPLGKALETISTCISVPAIALSNS